MIFWRGVGGTDKKSKETSELWKQIEVLSSLLFGNKFV